MSESLGTCPKGHELVVADVTMDKHDITYTLECPICICPSYALILTM